MDGIFVGFTSVGRQNFVMYLVGAALIWLVGLIYWSIR